MKLPALLRGEQLYPYKWNRGKRFRLYGCCSSHAWNWTIIGYPSEGTVRLTRTGKSNIEAEFDVEYRCVGYVYRGGEGETVHEGWEAKPAKQCPQSLFPPKISFGSVKILDIGHPPEILPYTGGAS